MANELTPEEQDQLNSMKDSEDREESIPQSQIRDKYEIASFVAQPTAPMIKRSILENKEKKENQKENEFVPHFQSLTKELKLGNIKKEDIQIWELRNELIIQASNDGLEEYMQLEMAMREGALLLTGSIEGITQKQILAQMKETKHLMGKEKGKGLV